jgi:predicted KAP-like P-loop ATPase
MWADNETTIDLLGFDYLSTALVEVLTESRLLPVTVGVFGDWGSGKSSLMRMGREVLESKDGVATIEFSAWQFESYEDVKAALMQVILQRLQQEQGLSEEAAGALKKLVKRVDWFYALSLAATRIATLTPPTLDDLQRAVRPTEDAGDTETQAIQDFRRDFGALMAEIESIESLVVFIDDLDRCLPTSIIETFEAIRLFLAVPKTAFVIAADERIIRYAIHDRYPAVTGDIDLGRDYLEKIVQVPLRIPPLTGTEVESYLNLLFAQIELEANEYEGLCAAATEARSSDPLAVACNYGIAAEILTEVPEELQRDFDLAARIAPVLAGGLNGNPRQLKRFMNALMLRQRAAKSRGVTLDAAVLAKLMVLEYLHELQFRTLFELQAVSDGRPPELAEAEKAAADGDEASSPEAQALIADAALRSWLTLDPPLSGEDLQPYFYFSRDRIEITAPGRRLPRHLQELLAPITSESAAHRSGAQKAAVELPEAELRQFYEALGERFTRVPAPEVAESLIEIAAGREEVMPLLLSTLAATPPVRLTRATIFQFGAKVGLEQSRPLLERWMEQTEAPLAAQAAKTTLTRLVKAQE